ncbi:MAG TPA: sugar transferase [Coriobacteriia bacterium]|jgi:exopolysaccharide biosynthesis polyprenyl glycosylphosphotransferase
MSRGRFIALSLLLDAALVNVGVAGAFVIRFYLAFLGPLTQRNVDPYLRLAVPITVLYLAAGYIYGLYEPERTENSWAVVGAGSQAVLAGSLFTLAAFYIAGPAYFAFPRLVLVIAFPLQVLLLLGWRLVAMRTSPITWPEQRVLIVGAGELAAELAVELERRSRWGYRVLGLVARDEGEAAALRSAGGRFPVLGTVDGLRGIVRGGAVDRIIVASPVALREIVEDLALTDESDVRVDVIPELYEIFIGTVDSIVADIPLMEITRRTVPAWFGGAKRGIDILFGAVLLVIASPVLLVAALATALTSGFPILFRQERVGKDLRPFPVLKLRTMVKDAEKLSGPVLATEDDPRITSVGRVLRTFRIDELPQLVNILRGEMSFVGPRPERPFFVERHLLEIPGYRERFRIKPGVTGLAQVSGGYATTPERKLKYDLIYMYHQSLLMDTQILVETLRVVLTGRGAR